MSIRSQLRHWFTPHTTNNFRAKILHNSSIFFLIGLLFGANIFLRLLEQTPLHILGFSSSITINEVVTKTNEERLKAGLSPLNYNEKLADAARRKAANMLEENYWAHSSPSGKSPWTWFKAAGYNYLFAGENLAKDFGSTDRLISAWMASTTHKENIVNPKYKEIGIAVVPATLSGSETVLVVQLFGTPSNGGTLTTAPPPSVIPKPAEIAKIETIEPEPTPVPEVILSTPAPQEVVIAQVTPPKLPLNSFNLKKILSLFTTLLFVIALITDLILSRSQSLSRRVGNNWSHIIFINFILLATMIVKAGQIL